MSKLKFVFLTFAIIVSHDNSVLGSHNEPKIENVAPAIQTHVDSFKHQLEEINNKYVQLIQKSTKADYIKISVDYTKELDAMYSTFLKNRTNEYQSEYQVIQQQLSVYAGRAEFFGGRHWKHNRAVISMNGLHWQYQKKFTKTKVIHSHGDVKKPITHLPNGVRLDISAREAGFELTYRGSSRLNVVLECRFCRSHVSALSLAYADLNELKSIVSKSKN